MTWHMGDRPVEGEENVLDLDLERGIDEYQEWLEDDQPKHPLITFDISSKNQALTRTELDYIYRLYRIPTLVGVSMIGLGDDPAWPPVEAMAILKRFFECKLNISLSFYL